MFAFWKTWPFCLFLWHCVRLTLLLWPLAKFQVEYLTKFRSKVNIFPIGIQPAQNVMYWLAPVTHQVKRVQKVEHVVFTWLCGNWCDMDRSIIGIGWIPCFFSSSPCINKVWSFPVSIYTLIWLTCIQNSSMITCTSFSCNSHGLYIEQRSHAVILFAIRSCLWRDFTHEMVTSIMKWWRHYLCSRLLHEKSSFSAKPLSFARLLKKRARSVERMQCLMSPRTCCDVTRWTRVLTETTMVLYIF